MEHQIIANLHRRQLAGFNTATGLLSKDVSGFTQRSGNHGFTQWLVCGITTVGRQQGYVVIAAVHCRTHQIIKTGIHQHKVPAAHVFHCAHLGDQHTGFCHQETTRFDLQLHRMTQMCGNTLAGAVPQTKIVFGIDRLFAVLIGDRQPASGRNRTDVLAEVDHLLHHGVTHALQMLVVHPRPYMHMHANQLQTVLLNFFHRLR